MTTAIAAARAALGSPAMKWAVGGWSFFIAENYVLSENRTYLISKFGDDGYHVAYGTLSTLAMGSALYGYLRKVRNAEPLLWNATGPAPLGARVAGFVLLSAGLGMLSQIPPKVQLPVHYSADANDEKYSTLTSGTAPIGQAGGGRGGEVAVEGGGWKVRCPFDFTDKRDAAAADGPVISGLERITRHPGLWSIGLIGLGNACLVPSLPQKAWLAMPVFVALIGGAHTDSRYRRGMGGTMSVEYDSVTGNVPFAAILSGAQGGVTVALREFAREVKPLNAIMAVGFSGLWMLRKGRGVRIR
jgi:uncharacterized membrane protein